MFERNIAIRANAIGAKIAVGNFGGLSLLYRREAASSGNGDTGKDHEILSENKENKAEYQESNAVLRHGKGDFVPRESLVPLSANINITADCLNGLLGNMGNGEKNAVLEMLAIEDHHVEDVKDVAGNVKMLFHVPPMFVLN